MTTEVNAVTGTEVFSQFVYTVADRMAVAKISCFEAFDTDADLCLRLFVA